MNLAEAGYRDLAVAHNFYTRALDRIQALPGVMSAGTISALPIADREVSVRFSIQGRPAPAPESQPQAARAGHQRRLPEDDAHADRAAAVGFVRADFANAPPVALVSREAARRYWPGEDPIGRRIAFDGDQNRVARSGGSGRRRAGTRMPVSGPTPQVYVPSSWRPERSTAFVVRSAGADPTALAPSIRSELAQLDKSQPVYDIRSMQRVLVEDLGGHVSLHRHARLLCDCGADALCRGRVRPRVVHSQPAHARNRPSHGAGREARLRFWEWWWRAEACR